MKKIFFAAIPLLLFSFIIPTSTSTAMKTDTIYQFKVPGLAGGTIDFSKFKGKMILVVNTASKCGNTPQYDDLEKLYKTSA
jgi:glutathione peroxidase